MGTFTTSARQQCQSSHKPWLHGKDLVRLGDLTMAELSATNSPDIHSVCMLSSIGLRIQANSERCTSFFTSAISCRQHETGVKADGEEILLPQVGVGQKLQRLGAALSQAGDCTHKQQACPAAGSILREQADKLPAWPELRAPQG